VVQRGNGLPFVVLDVVSLAQLGVDALVRFPTDGVEVAAEINTRGRQGRVPLV
jgi:hypothetical protein